VQPNQTKRRSYATNFNCEEGKQPGASRPLTKLATWHRDLWRETSSFFFAWRGKQTQARQSVSDYNCQRHDYRNIDIDMWRFHILAAPQTRQDGHNMPSNADKQSHP
jgi:hypothetical protein